MKRLLFVLFIALYSLWATGQNLEGQSLIKETEADPNLNEKYTVPSATLYHRAKFAFNNTRSEEDSLALLDAIHKLVPSTHAYNINKVIHGDPHTQMGFTWYTNRGQQPGELQIVAGITDDPDAFKAPLLTFSADTLNIENTNYNVARNDLKKWIGWDNNQKRSYTSHKALATNLKTNSQYSYRVGKPGAWGPIGTFTTAPDTDSFSFIYTTDTQANTDEMFGISALTIKAADMIVDKAGFLLINGDLVESAGATNAEWEWEQWFETNREVWRHLPLVPVLGNHDKSVNKNFTHHFHTQPVGFDQAMSVSPGSVYSFAYANTLFIIASTEDYSKTDYLDSLKTYIRKEVEAHPDANWKIVVSHKAIYTGASHQKDNDARIVRQALAPLYDELGIDLAIQGHDHVYEVIGPVWNYSLVKDAVSEVLEVPQQSRINETGKQGGVFDVTKGTLYFLNNSAGKKKYNPLTKTLMESNYARTQVENYWDLFSGKLGQTGEPTFSDMQVTPDTISVTTYTVNDNGVPSVFDSFKITKKRSKSSLNRKADVKDDVIIYPNPAKNVIRVEGAEVISAEFYNAQGQLIDVALHDKNVIDTSKLPEGPFFLKMQTEKGIVVKRFLSTR